MAPRLAGVYSHQSHGLSARSCPGTKHTDRLKFLAVP